MKKIDRTGEVNYNKHGSKMMIIEYKDNKNITIEFANGYKTHKPYNDFKDGRVQNPYDKSVLKLGYIGEGKYKTTGINKKQTVQYSYWIGMLYRCYDKKYTKRHTTYDNKYVCDEWLNYQVFAEWFDNNYYEINGEQMHLDKDILYKGNRIYSPETCVFVPQRINVLFVKSDAIRGDYPIGVHWNKENKKFRSQCSVYNKKNKSFTQKHLGYYITPEEAFYKGYKPFKEAYIKEVANDYKSIIPNNLHNAMMNYIVEITD